MRRLFRWPTTLRWPVQVSIVNHFFSSDKMRIHHLHIKPDSSDIVKVLLIVWESQLPGLHNREVLQRYPSWENDPNCDGSLQGSLQPVWSRGEHSGCSWWMMIVEDWWWMTIVGDWWWWIILTRQGSFIHVEDFDGPASLGEYLQHLKNDSVDFQTYYVMLQNMHDPKCTSLHPSMLFFSF